MPAPATYDYAPDGKIVAVGFNRAPEIYDCEIIEIRATEYEVRHPNQTRKGQIVIWKFSSDSEFQCLVMLHVTREALRGMQISGSKYAAIDKNGKPVAVQILTQWYELRDPQSL